MGDGDGEITETEIVADSTEGVIDMETEVPSPEAAAGNEEAEKSYADRITVQMINEKFYRTSENDSRDVVTHEKFIAKDERGSFAEGLTEQGAKLNLMAGRPSISTNLETAFLEAQELEKNREEITIKYEESMRAAETAKLLPRDTANEASGKARSEERTGRLNFLRTAIKRIRQ